RERPAFEVESVYGDHLVGLPAVVAVEVPHRARQRCPDEAPLRLGVVLPAHLEGKQPVFAEVDGLLQFALGQVPEVESVPIPAGLDVGWVEALLVGVGLAELGRDERVLAWLVPEVVVEGRGRATALPAAL